MQLVVFNNWEHKQEQHEKIWVTFPSTVFQISSQHQEKKNFASCWREPFFTCFSWNNQHYNQSGIRGVSKIIKSCKESHKREWAKQYMLDEIIIMKSQLQLFLANVSYFLAIFYFL